MNQGNFAAQAKLQSGFALHQQGRIREAEILYQEALRLDKRNVDALHLIGVIHHQTGRHDDAVDFISRAIKLSPSAAMPYYNRGNALKALGRHAEALGDYSKAISLNPQYADAYNNRGTTLNDLGRFAEAVASYDKAVALRPDFIGAYNNRALSLKELGRHEEALASCNKAISLNPRSADAHNNRGLVLAELRRLDEALSSYSKAIELHPGHAEAHNNRGNVLTALHRLDEALASYHRALELRPGYAEAFSNAGNVLHAMNRFEEAVASYNRAIEINPDYAEAYNNRGIVLRRPRHLDAALADFEKAIALSPDFPEAYSNRGKVLKSLGRFDDALASFNKAIALKPDFAGAHFNKGQVELLLADFQSGWKNHEWRKKTEAPAGHRTFPKPLLTALSEAQGKTVLVHWEQGLGDTIQFCRYVNRLAEAGANVLFAPQADLKVLLKALNSGIAIVGADDLALDFDLHIPLMSLPLLFDTGLQTIPSATPFLSVDPVVVEQWSSKLGNAGLKVGICWQGNPDHKDDVFRSFPLALFEPLAGIAGIRLISLQKGWGKEKLQALPGAMTLEIPFDDLIPGVDPFVNTAAIMKNLDLVITPDTAVAHLAGLLGVPVWVALQYVPDWRWLLDRPDSPWYPGMRLFRQQADHDWKAVFEEIRTALLDFQAGRQRI